MNVVRPLWHLGPLHPVEQLLTLVLAFGPFVVLGIVIVLRRRADDRAEARAAEDATPADPPLGQAER